MPKINPAITNGFPPALPDLFKQFLTDCLELEQSFAIMTPPPNMTFMIKSYERVVEKYYKNKEIVDFLTRSKP